MPENGGWWLITHPDHAALAGHFAEQWGHGLFVPPEPREDVLTAIFHHDDGWRARDASPQVTKAGLPSAFSHELVGKYSAFEEIDLADYLTVRRNAVAELAASNAFAAILVSMHTYDLLTNRADRATIKADELPKLDAFLLEQRALQTELRAKVRSTSGLPPELVSDVAFDRHFRLLQACDNLSLLSCVDYPGAASLLHPLATRGGSSAPVQVERVGSRRLRLSPSPFPAGDMEFQVPARFVAGQRFSSGAELSEKFNLAPVQLLSIHILS